MKLCDIYNICDNEMNKEALDPETYKKIMSRLEDRVVKMQGTPVVNPTERLKRVDKTVASHQRAEGLLNKKLKKIRETPGAASWRAPKKTKINVEQTAAPKPEYGGSGEIPKSPKPEYGGSGQVPKSPAEKIKKKVIPSGEKIKKLLPYYVKPGLIGGGVGAGLGYLTSNSDNEIKNTVLGSLLGVGAGTGYRYLNRLGKIKGSWVNNLSKAFKK